MTKKPDETLASIEQSQSALRESIAAAKQLTERSEFLLSEYRRRHEQDGLDADVRKAD